VERLDAGAYASFRSQLYAYPTSKKPYKTRKERNKP